MSARSKARRRWRRYGEHVPTCPTNFCQCGGLCDVEALQTTEAGCAWCPTCGHVLGRDIVRGLHARRSLYRKVVVDGADVEFWIGGLKLPVRSLEYEVSR